MNVIELLGESEGRSRFECRCGRRYLRKGPRFLVEEDNGAIHRAPRVDSYLPLPAGGNNVLRPHTWVARQLLASGLVPCSRRQLNRKEGTTGPASPSG